MLTEVDTRFLSVPRKETGAGEFGQLSSHLSATYLVKVRLLEDQED